MSNCGSRFLHDEQKKHKVIERIVVNVMVARMDIVHITNSWRATIRIGK